MPQINKIEMVTNIHLFLLTPGLIPGVNVNQKPDI